jgi:dTDP-4-amino-4,6-dideoxygalactose transaminase
MYVIGAQEVAAVARVIRRRQFFRYGDPRRRHGNEVVKFEREWARKIGTRYCVATTSGTASLICALVGAGIGPGDEVIVPGYTFIATALAVTAVGAIPIIVDIDESCTIDPEAIKAAITPRSRAVVPVHMMGMPCHMGAIQSVARSAGLLVIEDACQAVGGSYRGRRLGSIGHAGVFSFNHYKIITCGEGGAVVTDRKDLYERAFIEHDGSCSLWPQVGKMGQQLFAGNCFRSNEIAAAILRVQLRRLDRILARLRSVRRLTVERFQPTDKVWLAPSYDPEGDCGVQVLLTTDGEQTTRRLLSTVAGKLRAVTPADSGRHIYSNWQPILQRRGAHHPGLDPYRLPQNRSSKVRYSPKMLPRTNQILARSVMIHCDMDKTPSQVRAVVDRLNRAVARL